MTNKDFKITIPVETSSEQATENIEIMIAEVKNRLKAVKEAWRGVHHQEEPTQWEILCDDHEILGFSITKLTY